MKACFADNAQVPISCSHDIDEVYNCQIASEGVPRDKCQYWRPDLAVTLAQTILGDGYCILKDGVYIRMSP